jgi:phosphomannomutase
VLVLNKARFNMRAYNSKDFTLKFGTSGVRGLVQDFTFESTSFFVKGFLKTIHQGLISQTVVLGHDLRPSSPSILNDAFQGVVEAGLQAIYVGALPTPAIAVYAKRLNSPAIVITGSHIPFDRNGIKFYRPDGEISKADEVAMMTAVVNIPDKKISNFSCEVNLDAYEHYLNRYLDFFGKGSLDGMRIAVYEHSSVARDLLKDLLIKLGAKVVSLGRTDSFVPIDTEAVRKEDVEQAKQWAAEYEFDAILSTDGDADRPLIGDENGNWLRGDVVGILCAYYLKADVVVTPVSSNTALEKSNWFNQIIRTKIGSPYVIAEMENVNLKQQRIVGFEANGGFLLGSDIEVNGKGLEKLPTRDAVLPMLAILALSRDLKCKVSELPNRLPKRFTFSDRIQNFAIEKSAALLSELAKDNALTKKMLGPSLGEIISVDDTDGYRATFASGDIVHLRPSGNAPELRCYAESSSEAEATVLCKSCLDRVLLGY